MDVARRAGDLPAFRAAAAAALDGSSLADPELRVGRYLADVETTHGGRAAGAAAWETLLARPTYCDCMEAWLAWASWETAGGGADAARPIYKRAFMRQLTSAADPKAETQMTVCAAWLRCERETPALREWLGTIQWIFASPFRPRHPRKNWFVAVQRCEPPRQLAMDGEIQFQSCKASGKGGQHVNTTDSAVRITHVPTGIVVSMQNEKSQLQNREAGMRVLRARLLAKQQEERDAQAADARRSQIRGMDRSERIRTYNFPENRIADHRTGYKSYNLDQVMDGALGPIIESAITADEEARLAALSEG
jgi:putative peptide chain release factor H